MQSSLGIGCLALLMIIIGLNLSIKSAKAIKTGEKVSIGRALRGSRAKVTPYFTLPAGALFLGLGIAGLVKAYRDKNKYPF